MRRCALALMIAGLAWGFATGLAAETPDPFWQTVNRYIETPSHVKLQRNMRAQSDKPSKFESDGCSGGMSSGWQMFAQTFPSLTQRYADAPPWQSCCVAHDRAYHNAGATQSAHQSFDARMAADRRLHLCVVQQGDEMKAQYGAELGVPPELINQAYILIGQSMFHAVRLGGGPCTGLSWRWGYGFEPCLWE